VPRSPGKQQLHLRFFFRELFTHYIIFIRVHELSDFQSLRLTPIFAKKFSSPQQVLLTLIESVFTSGEGLFSGVQHERRRCFSGRSYLCASCQECVLVSASAGNLVRIGVFVATYSAKKMDIEFFHIHFFANEHISIF